MRSMAHPTESSRFGEIRVSREGISLRFEATPLDDLALAFFRLLNRERVRYALVGGYVAILLGRPRGSEDVDVLCEPLDYERFAKLHARVLRTFTCITPGRPRLLFDDYLSAGRESTAVRYHARGQNFTPNMEFKFATKPLDRRAIRLRIPVDANGVNLFVAPIGMQIGYKLYLGGPKDIEDARWMYRVAEGHFDEEELWRTAEALHITRREGRKRLGTR